MASYFVPQRYQSLLSVRQTEAAIKLIKDTFERLLAQSLTLERISAPLFVRPESGLNDDLNGIERPVQFDIKDLSADVQIVHSLAKWKRMALKKYQFEAEHGLYTDMNAIRRDEDLDNVHSVYVDQWDWERVITEEERNFPYLLGIVEKIFHAICDTEQILYQAYPAITPFLERNFTAITTQELEDRYPNLTPKEREDAICKEKQSVFIMQIGGKLKSGTPHDGRAPDYDDWTLNGDILIWYEPLQRALELSSMGIRVDPQTLEKQLHLSGCERRKSMPFHKMLLQGELPLTIGGGIGQSRLCMVMLHKAHIGEVQAAIWSDEMIETCEKHGIHLL